MLCVTISAMYLFVEQTCTCSPQTERGMYVLCLGPGRADRNLGAEQRPDQELIITHHFMCPQIKAAVVVDQDSSFNTCP